MQFFEKKKYFKMIALDSNSNQQAVDLDFANWIDPSV
jgi:hypothetical protein